MALRTAFAALALTALAAAPVSAQTIEQVIRSGADPAREAATEAAARHFYAFWNTGAPAELSAAIAPDFTDRTLPAGRPQGPEGPATASAAFRAAVPDLGVAIRRMVIAGDWATVHMVFSGHFTGAFNGVQGQGQPIEFIATDLVRVEDGRIADNWHIEDNLALLTQMGLVVPAEGAK
ncbi:ester cyclase [uncultured Albimonas sp.]|uniref:ester cyclase n=1 Tax=uncultured Albimonas sp. TaxID=1331701 RepID=UPI0030EEE03F|tara:strand:- start:679 stop:1212 length:534 start_codon:yes stop_codon:yes gene_type:complete